MAAVGLPGSPSQPLPMRQKAGVNPTRPERAAGSSPASGPDQESARASGETQGETTPAGSIRPATAAAGAAGSAATAAAVATVAESLGIPAQDTYTPPTNIAYEIEAGMRAPVALLPHDRPMSPQVAGALESIRQDFDREISSAADPAAVWDDARKRADEAYKQMFGFEAFNQMTMQDAIDALQSRKQTP